MEKEIAFFIEKKVSGLLDERIDTYDYELSTSTRFDKWAEFKIEIKSIIERHFELEAMAEYENKSGLEVMKYSLEELKYKTALAACYSHKTEIETQKWRWLENKDRMQYKKYFAEFERLPEAEKMILNKAIKIMGGDWLKFYNYDLEKIEVMAEKLSRPYLPK